PQVDAQMRLRPRIGPPDAIVRIEDDDALGQGFGAPDETIERQAQVTLPSTTLAHAPVERCIRQRPGAASLRNRRVDGTRGPLRELVQLPEVPSKRGQQPRYHDG